MFTTLRCTASARCWLLLVLGAVLAPVSLQAAPPQRTTVVQHQSSFRGDTAQAIFVEHQGCVQTHTVVYVSHGITHADREPGWYQPGVELAMTQWNTCTGTLLLEAIGREPIADGAFAVTGNIHQSGAAVTARLHTPVWVGAYDPQRDLFREFGVTVDLEWISTSDPKPVNAHTHYAEPAQRPSFVINEHFHATARSALVTGSISDGQTTYVAAPSQSATLMDVREGRVTMGR